MLNPDGTPYTTTGSVQQFNPDSPDHCLMNFYDKEMIHQIGSPIFYYEMFEGPIDPLFLEARSKIFSNNPIQLWAMYEPIPADHTINQYGYVGLGDIIFELNHEETIAAIGHIPKIGSRVYTPHLRENWAVVACKADLFQLWGLLRIKMVCKRFQESSTTGEGKVTQKHPNFKIP